MSDRFGALWIKGLKKLLVYKIVDKISQQETILFKYIHLTSIPTHMAEEK